MYLMYQNNEISLFIIIHQIMYLMYQNNEITPNFNGVAF